MGKRTKEMLDKTIALHSKGWTKRKIAKECGVSPQYVGKLIKMHEENQHKSPERSYGLSARVLNCLRRNHIPIDADVIAESIDLLLCMRGIGQSSLEEIGNMLTSIDIIDNVDDWVEGGKHKQYNQRENSFSAFPYDLTRQYKPYIRI